MNELMYFITRFITLVSILTLPAQESSFDQEATIVQYLTENKTLTESADFLHFFLEISSRRRL